MGGGLRVSPSHRKLSALVGRPGPVLLGARAIKQRRRYGETNGVRLEDAGVPHIRSRPASTRHQKRSIDGMLAAALPTLLLLLEGVRDF